MQGVFVNHTNHPFKFWAKAQLAAAHFYGEVVDEAFPTVGADWDETQIRNLVDTMLARILAMHPSAVLCQGEFTYVYALTRRLQMAGVPVLAACSERVTIERVDAAGISHRVSEFHFVRFRKYEV